MGSRFRRTEAFRYLVWLLVLTASVGASSQGYTSRRTHPFTPRQTPARSAFVRARALSQGCLFRALRSVVGVASDGSTSRAGHEPPLDPGTRFSPRLSAACRSCDGGGAARRDPPLRC
jgi:hypothetical protein